MYIQGVSFRMFGVFCSECSIGILLKKVLRKRHLPRAMLDYSHWIIVVLCFVAVVVVCLLFVV